MFSCLWRHFFLWFLHACMPIHWECSVCLFSCHVLLSWFSASSCLNCFHALFSSYRKFFYTASTEMSAVLYNLTFISLQINIDFFLKVFLNQTNLKFLIWSSEFKPSKKSRSSDKTDKKIVMQPNIKVLIIYSISINDDNMENDNDGKNTVHLWLYHFCLKFLHVITLNQTEYQ